MSPDPLSGTAVVVDNVWLPIPSTEFLPGSSSKQLGAIWNDYTDAWERWKSCFLCLKHKTGCGFFTFRAWRYSFVTKVQMWQALHVHKDRSFVAGF